MGKGFVMLPDAQAFRLVNACAPSCLVSGAVLASDGEGLARLDIAIEAGRIVSILPAGMASQHEDWLAFDMGGGIVLPRLVDVHTHLDKGHIWPRAANPDGSFYGALSTVMADREAHWSREDVRARMDFALRCAFAHGTGAIRTHLDSLGPQIDISWPLFAEMRAEWAGRIALQAAAIFRVDVAVDDEPQFRHLVKTVAKHGGALGGVTYLGHLPDEKIRLSIRRIFEAAKAEGLDIDLHVDESASPDAHTLEIVADTALATGFKGKILAGHCCSLALMTEADAARVIAKLGEAGVAIVSLPMCNMYLQDREQGRTPRWRGVAPLHELKAAGVPVMVSSDNTRDPFYAYGDLDLIEVLREATRILQFDHSGKEWAASVATTPASVMGLADKGRISVGGPADLILMRGRSFTELFARPQSDRTVLVNGKPIDTSLPDYRELDHLFAGQNSYAAGASA
ncbi:MAG: cytosine deaminase [Bosea sp. (in: a-proteobacteria)]